MARTMTAGPLAGGDAPARGLLVTADPALVRAFRRELRDCLDCSVTFDVQQSVEAAQARNDASYQWVVVDLDGAVAQAEAVRVARDCWSDACVAVLSYWWSDRDAIARGLADFVVHRPLRSNELQAFLRSPAAATRAAKAEREAIALAAG